MIRIQIIPLPLLKPTKKKCSERNEPSDTEIIIVFLPILMQNIKTLQKVVKKFIIEHKLFPNWHIVTSEENLTEEQMLKKMKENGKERVLFFTGKKGGTGSTYNKCSLSIHFDNSSSPEQYMQHVFRAATPKEGHKYFFTFDMNIHRSFEYQYQITENLFGRFKGKKSMEECYLYARESDLIIFNPPKHCREFKDLSKEERLDLFKKDWSNIESSQVLHRFSKEFKFPTTTTDNEIDMDIINQLFPLILPFISKSIFKYKKPDNTEEDGTDESETENPNENVRPKEKNRKVGTRDKTQRESHIPTDIEKKDIVYKFCEFFINHLCFWMFVLQISLDELFEMEDFIFEILEKFLDLEKLINSSFNKENLFDIMKQVSRLNPKLLDTIKGLYKNKQFGQIREQLEKMLIVSEKEKNERGFVITPSLLAEEMVSKIPTEFWKKIHLTLDPCCGYGIFPLLVFELFNKHLTIHNKEKKVRTIIEKCIFFSDISPYNVKITKQLLQFHCDKVVGKKVEGLKFNCWVGDTLKMNYKRKFDLVVGNPPYQQEQKNSGKKGGGDLLWNKFVTLSIELLKPNGFLVFVHPSGWRKPESEKSKYTGLFDLMTKKNQMVYLSIHNTEDGMKTFKCGTRYDWYLIEKKPKYKDTEIQDEKGKMWILNLEKWKFLPNSDFNVIKKILTKGKEKSCDIIYNRTNYGSDKNYVSSKESKEYKYPLIHSTPKSGIRYMYSKRKDLGHFGISKVIFGETGINNPVLDMKGKYGMTQHAMAILISNKYEGIEIQKALESKKFQTLLNACSWSNFQIDWRMFKYFKKDWYKQFLS